MRAAFETMIPDTSQLPSLDEGETRCTPRIRIG
jgi:hypothetical protein